MKHTPAPWSAFIGSDGRTISICIGNDANGQTPCIVNWPGFDSNGLATNENIANASLIAAAPELLEALEVVNNSIQTTGFFRNSSMHGMIQNALRKAKGETP